jgi:hypothetical protein
MKIYGVWADEAGQERIFENEEEEHDVDISGNDVEYFWDIFHNTNAEFMDEEHDIWQHLFDAFDVGDELLAETSRQQRNEEERDDPQTDTIDGVEHLYEQASTPVWRNSSMSVISATIVLMNMAVG